MSSNVEALPNRPEPPLHHRDRERDRLHITLTQTGGRKQTRRGRWGGGREEVETRTLFTQSLVQTKLCVCSRLPGNRIVAQRGLVVLKRAVSHLIWPTAEASCYLQLNFKMHSTEGEQWVCTPHTLESPFRGFYKVWRITVTQKQLSDTLFRHLIVVLRLKTESVL